MSHTVEFTVIGPPQPAGSKRAVTNRTTGRTHIIDDAKGSRPWKNAVAATAAEHHVGDLLRGPLEVTFTFYRPRPKGHYGTGRNAGVVKASAPAFPTTRPDALKTARGVEDAITGVIWNDDAQIVDEHLHKRFGSPTRCEVRITTIDDGAAA